MDFWRIWRLINRRIYLVIGLALVAAVLVVIGIFIQNARAGVVADARLTLQQSGPTIAAGSNGDAVLQADLTSKRISELTTQLSGNNNIYMQAAELLRKDEESRKKEVYSILERNQYFAPYDAQIADKVEQLVRDRELPENQLDATREAQRRKFRQDEVARLAAPRDRQGAYSPEGVKLEAAEIADVYRQQVEIKPVTSLMDTDNARQFDNQIQVMGNFQQESQALLYLNMLSVAFVDYYATNAQGSTRVAIARLLKQKAAAEQEREAAVNQLAAFKNQSITASIIDQNTTGQSFQVQEIRLAELRAARDSAREAFLNAQAVAASTPQTLVTKLPAEENPRYQKLQLAVDAAEDNYNRLAATKGANDPELITAKEALSKQRALRDQAKKGSTNSALNPLYIDAQRKLNDARTQLSTAEAQVKPLEELFNKLNQRLRSQPKLYGEFSRLSQKIDSTTKVLQSIEADLNRAKMEDIQSSRSGTIQITRAYVLPSKNTWANGIKLLLYATTLALLLGIALVIGLDALDNSVRTKKDAEDVLGLPVAGEIPAQLPDPQRAPRVAYLDPLSPTAEAYRLLRTDILFSQLEHPFKSLLIATVKPGQGATTTATNLAITLAQAGKKVILVDGDLRHPSLHQVFSLPNDRGLTTLLAGTSQAIDEALQRTEIESLLVLTSGPLPLNPSELVGSAQMRELHERLKAVADIVIVDAPSAIAFSDTSVLASFVDATMLVIRAGDVPRGAVEQVKGMLTKARANLIGVVLNAAPSESVDSVHYHNQYYPRLKAAGVMGHTIPEETAGELEEEDRFERLMSEGASDDDDEDEDDEPEFLSAAPVASLQNPGVVSRAVPEPAPVVPVVPEPVVQAPVAQPPVAQAPVVPAPLVQAPVVQTPVVQAPVVQAPVEPSRPVMSVATAPEAAPAPVVEPPRAVFFELPYRPGTVELTEAAAAPAPVAVATPVPPPPPPPAVTHFASAPVELPRPTERKEPLKTNWGTSPMVAPTPQPEPESKRSREEEIPTQEPVAPVSPLTVPAPSDDDIVFEFDSADDDDDYLEDFDEEYDDEYDEDYDDDEDYDEERPRKKKKPAGLGGILSWFRRGR